MQTKNNIRFHSLPAKIINQEWQTLVRAALAEKRGLHTIAGEAPLEEAAPAVPMIRLPVRKQTPTELSRWDYIAEQQSEGE